MEPQRKYRMPFQKFIAFILLSVVVGCSTDTCDRSLSTTPTNTNTPTTTPPTTPPDIPFNPGVTFSWDNTRGILIFPGTQATEIEIVALDSRLKSKGWPTITYHICAETSFWAAQGARLQGLPAILRGSVDPRARRVVSPRPAAPACPPAPRTRRRRLPRPRWRRSRP